MFPNDVLRFFVLAEHIFICVCVTRDLVSQTFLEVSFAQDLCNSKKLIPFTTVVGKISISNLCHAL